MIRIGDHQKTLTRTLYFLIHECHPTIIHNTPFQNNTLCFGKKNNLKIKLMLLNFDEIFLFFLIKVVIGDSSPNGLIQVYDSNKILTQSFKAHDSIIKHIKMLSDNKVASCSTDMTIKIWDATTWSQIQTLSGHTAFVNQIEQIDSDTIVSSSDDTTYRVWSISTGAQIKNKTFANIVYAVKLLKSGLLAVGLDSTSNNLQIFNWTMDTLITTLNSHTNRVNDIEILDSQFIASASVDKKVIIWDLTGSGSLKYSLSGHVNYVSCLRLISSTLLASTSHDKAIRIWNWNTGSLVRTLIGHTSWIWKSLDIFSGNVLISGSGDMSIKFWNITNGSLIESIPSNISINTLTMLSSGKFIYFIFKVKNLR